MRTGGERLGTLEDVASDLGRGLQEELGRYGPAPSLLVLGQHASALLVLAQAEEVLAKVAPTMSPRSPAMREGFEASYGGVVHLSSPEVDQVICGAGPALPSFSSMILSEASCLECLRSMITRYRIERIRKEGLFPVHLWKQAGGDRRAGTDRWCGTPGDEAVVEDLFEVTCLLCLRTRVRATL